MLAGIQFTHIADFMVMMPLGPQFMRLFSISPQQFGVLVSSYTFAAAVAGLLAALVVDRFDRKRVVLFLYGAFTLATLFCGLAPNYSSLLIARCLAGAFGGVLSAMVFTLAADLIPESRRGVATGTIMAAFSVSTIFGVPMGLTLAAHLDTWRAPFFFLGGLSLLILIVAQFVLPSVTRHVRAQHLTLQEAAAQIVTVLRYRNHQKAFLLMTLMMLSGFTVIPFISIYINVNVGVRFVDLPYIYLAGGAATLFSSRFIGRMADRYGKQWTYRVVATSSLIPLLVITHMPPTPLPWVVLFFVLFFVFVSGRIIPGLAIVTSSAIPAYRGTFMSLNSSVQQAASGVAALIGAGIVSRAPDGQLLHYDRVGYVAVAATLVAMWLVGKVRVQR
ncbi:MAG: MFS transporter [Burkholderiaceae bacterium]|nr:MAG: MFS transporter [Burkholderiaceae bacterium]